MTGTCESLLSWKGMALVIGVVFVVVFRVTTNEISEIAKPPKLVQSRSTNTNNSPGDIRYSRNAYLISINATSERTLHSIELLKSVGFSNIILEIAPFVGPSSDEKKLSNKMAQLGIYHKIVADNSRPWGYIFEDDIALCRTQSQQQQNDKVAPSSITEEKFSVMEHLVCGENNRHHCMESQHSSFMWLGSCGPLQKWRHGHVWNESYYCGKCAHAYGISRVGAKALMDFDKTFEHPRNRSMDVVTEKWCRKQGGFPISDIDCYNKEEPAHKGTFFQDRQQFRTIIGP